MVSVNAQNLPWVLIGLLVTALLAVFYAMLRGTIVPRSVADQLSASCERRAEIAEAGTAANTASIDSLTDFVGKLMVLAENQDKVLRELHDRAARSRYRGDS